MNEESMRDAVTQWGTFATPAAIAKAKALEAIEDKARALGRAAREYEERARALAVQTPSGLAEMAARHAEVIRKHDSVTSAAALKMGQLASDFGFTTGPAEKMRSAIDAAFAPCQRLEALDRFEKATLSRAGILGGLTEQARAVDSVLHRDSHTRGVAEHASRFASDQMLSKEPWEKWASLREQAATPMKQYLESIAKLEEDARLKSLVPTFPGSPSPSAPSVAESYYPRLPAPTRAPDVQLRFEESFKPLEMEAVAEFLSSSEHLADLCECDVSDVTVYKTYRLLRNGAGLHTITLECSCGRVLDLREWPEFREAGAGLRLVDDEPPESE
jgi:hypothetical protein